MSISTIKRRYYSITKRLGAPKKHVRFATVPQHDGAPYIAMNETAEGIDAFKAIFHGKQVPYTKSTA